MLDAGKGSGNKLYRIRKPGGHYTSGDMLTFQFLSDIKLPKSTGHNNYLIETDVRFNEEAINFGIFIKRIQSIIFTGGINNWGNGGCLKALLNYIPFQNALPEC